MAGVRRRRGLQSEVLVSLAIVMLTATGVLGALLERTHETNARGLQHLAARALLEDASSPLLDAGVPASLLWWSIDADGRERPRGGHGSLLGPEARALGLEARELGRPLLRTGPPWQAMRFAAPVGDEVAVALLPPTASSWLLLSVLVVDVMVFTCFGAYLLRGRLVRPLQRLALASRSIASGDLAARVPAEGPRETFELATAFNEMTDSLEERTRALEKAVADLRESNQQLRTARAGLDRAERLAAVGSLAAGVAHEVGNPMGALLGFLDLAGRDSGLGAEGRSHLERASREGARVRSILRQLLDFSRPPRAERAPVDLCEVARETAGLLRAQRSYADIAVEVSAEGEPPAALADRTLVAQVLLNLMLNAADALHGSATPEPRLEVRVRAGVASARAHDGAGGDVASRSRPDAVECEVADNGPGVPESDRERVFDPFFTTKDPGEGTGLGLSNALRFAEELGGTLELAAAEAGRGARFVLRLPAAGVGLDGQAREG